MNVRLPHVLEWLQSHEPDVLVLQEIKQLTEKFPTEALAEAGYTPPDPDEPIDVIGANRGASFQLGAQLFVWGGYASEHDQLIAGKIAHVLSGGMNPIAKSVTAQDLLDLEREAFVSLCGEAKTFERINAMLTTGKPLRN